MSTLPKSSQPVVEQSPRGESLFTKPWYRFLADVFDFLTTGSQSAAVAVTVGASPYSYTAPSFGTLAVSGGTVTAIAYGRGGVFVPLGVIAGPIPVSPGDVVRITHAGAPAASFIPR